MSESSLRERKGEHPLGDAGQLIFLALFLIIWVGDSFFLHISTFPSMYLPLAIRLIIAGLAFILSLYLYRSGHVVVSHEQRPEGVVDTGAFRYIRHPLYLAAILFYLTLTVSTFSLICLGLLLIILIFYNYIAGYEENLMEAKFGEDYRSYKKRTGKWIPHFGK